MLGSIEKEKQEEFTFAWSKNLVQRGWHYDYMSSELDLKRVKNQKEKIRDRKWEKGNWREAGYLKRGLTLEDALAVLEWYGYCMDNQGNERRLL